MFVDITRSARLVNKKNFPSKNNSGLSIKKNLDFTDNKKTDKGDRLFFIDFGLGFMSSRIEDKAVDLHLIKQALEAKHYVNFERFFKAVLKGYEKSENYSKTMKQFEKVEKRGRYKEQF